MPEKLLEMSKNDVSRCPKKLSDFKTKIKPSKLKDLKI